MGNERKNPKRPGRPGPRGGWMAPPFTKANAAEMGRRGGLKSVEKRRAKRAAREREEEADRYWRRTARLPEREEAETPKPEPDAAPSWTPAPPSREIWIVPHNGTRPMDPGVQFVFGPDPWSDEEAERIAAHYRARGHDVLVAR